MEDHGRQSHRLPLRKQTPLEMLRFLVAEHAMNVAALGKVLGNKTAASLVLSGKRELSKSHIRRLAEYFKVDAGLFI
jgi:HTH-type transcriptional regulator/antitoxin HigA